MHIFSAVYFVKNILGVSIARHQEVHRMDTTIGT